MKRPHDCDTWNRVESRVLALGDNNSFFFLLSSVARVKPSNGAYALLRRGKLEILNFPPLV